MKSETDAASIAHQWQNGGGNITGATNNIYSLGQTDVGSSISVKACYTDGQGTAENVISSRKCCK